MMTVMWLFVAAAFLVGWVLGRRTAWLSGIEARWREENRALIEDIRSGRWAGDPRAGDRPNPEGRS